jgi:predicted Holliday junction resolvase-like endonuclease
MSIQFLLFVIAILLVSIFWVLSKINSLLKKTLLREKEQDYERAKKVA